MDFIKKIKKAAELNNLNVRITSAKKWFYFYGIGAHTRNMANPYKIIVGDSDKLFKSLCVHLIQSRKGTEGYTFSSDGVDSRTTFIDGDYKIVISNIINTKTRHIILIYKNK